MKKLWAAALTVAAASTGLAGFGAVSAPASAAGSTNAIFYHGTSRDAHFQSRATCEAYSRYWVKQIASKPAQVTLIPAYSDPGITGPESRTSCYPVSTGQWSYLIAYFAKKGVPLTKYDHFVNIDDRFGPALKADNEATWGYLHAVARPSTYWSVATCNKSANWTASKVGSNANVRLVNAQLCASSSGEVSYGVLYLAARPGAQVIAGDESALLGTTVASGFPMLDVLGYDYTYLSDPTAKMQLAARHAQVKKMATTLPR